MFARWIVAFVTSLLFSAAAHAADSAALMARFKDASGGAAWDRVTTLHASGTLGAGGMSGDVTHRPGPFDGPLGRCTTSSVRSRARTATTASSPGRAIPAAKSPRSTRPKRSAARAARRGSMRAAYWYPERIEAS